MNVDGGRDHARYGVRADRLFDGEVTADRATLLVEGGRIVAVGEVIPESVPIVELRGMTLMPGLIDSHQHLCFDGNGTLEEQVAGVTDDDLRTRARAAAAVALRGGITTLRDLGDRGFVTLDLRSDSELPTILASGPPITMPGGHCFFLGGACSGEESLRRAVRERADRGCDVVKVMMTGGALTPTFPMWKSQFTTAELQAIVDEAHHMGLPVAAHCHGIDGIESALKTRVDSIEHCTFYKEEGRSEPPNDLLDRLAASGIGLSMTLGRLSGSTPPPMVAANYDTVRSAAVYMAERGATICVGTDAGIAPGKPHDVLPNAFGEFVEAGLSAAWALRALTSVAARVIGMSNSKGHLRPGFDADVIAVTGDPLTDDDKALSIESVWAGGFRVR